MQGYQHHERGINDGMLKEDVLVNQAFTEIKSPECLGDDAFGTLDQPVVVSSNWKLTCDGQLKVVEEQFQLEN